MFTETPGHVEQKVSQTPSKSSKVTAFVLVVDLCRALASSTILSLWYIDGSVVPSQRPTDNDYQVEKSPATVPPIQEIYTRGGKKTAASVAKGCRGKNERKEENVL